MIVSSYTPKQMTEIMEFLSKNFKGRGYIAHETESEYVHTDVYVSEDCGIRNYVSFGMGSEKMDAPLEYFERAELIMYSTTDFEAKSPKSREALMSLVSLTKYPFRNNTWFGPGHTVDAPKRFMETFGYKYLLFAPTSLVFSPEDMSNGIQNVRFLVIVPIYEDEREWIIENDSNDYMELLYNKFGDDVFKIDSAREHYIPTQEDLLSLKGFSK